MYIYIYYVHDIVFEDSPRNGIFNAAAPLAADVQSVLLSSTTILFDTSCGHSLPAKLVVPTNGLGGFQASDYGFSRGWTQDDIDTKNYFFYLYDDQGLRPDRAAQRVVLLPPGGCDLERIEPLAGAPDVVMRNCIRERRLECSIEQIFGPGASA